MGAPPGQLLPGEYFIPPSTPSHVTTGYFTPSPNQGGGGYHNWDGYQSPRGFTDTGSPPSQPMRSPSFGKGGSQQSFGGIFESPDGDDPNSPGRSEAGHGSEAGSVGAYAKRRVSDASKTRLKTIDITDTDAALNSHAGFMANVSSLSLTVAAEDGGDADEEVMLRILLLKWVEANKIIMTDLRTTFGAKLATTAGSILIEHVRVGYVEAMVAESGEAEQQLKEFQGSWHEVFNGDAAKAHRKMGELWSIVARVPEVIAGDTTYWISKAFDNMPHDVYTEMHRFLTSKTPAEQHEVRTSSSAFAKALGSALQIQKRRVAASGSMHINLNFGGKNAKGGRPQSAGSESRAGERQGAEKVLCGCKMHSCLHGADPSQPCDVNGKPTAERLKFLGSDAKKGYRFHLDKARERAKKPKLVYPNASKAPAGGPAPSAAKKTPPATNAHGLREISDKLDEFEEGDESASNAHSLPVMEREIPEGLGAADSLELALYHLGLDEVESATEPEWLLEAGTFANYVESQAHVSPPMHGDSLESAPEPEWLLEAEATLRATEIYSVADELLSRVSSPPHGVFSAPSVSPSSPPHGVSSELFQAQTSSPSHGVYSSPPPPRHAQQLLEDTESTGAARVSVPNTTRRVATGPTFQEIKVGLASQETQAVARALELQVSVKRWREEALMLQQSGCQEEAAKVMAHAESMRTLVDDMLRCARSKMRIHLEPLPQPSSLARAASLPSSSPSPTSPEPARSASVPTSPGRVKTKPRRWADYADEQDEEELEEWLRQDLCWPGTEPAAKWTPELAASSGGAEVMHASAPSPQIEASPGLFLMAKPALHIALGMLGAGTLGSPPPSPMPSPPQCGGGQRDIAQSGGTQPRLKDRVAAYVEEAEQQLAAHTLSDAASVEMRELGKRLLAREAKMGKGTPDQSTFEAGLVKWDPRPVTLLLDTCSDVHIIRDPAAFITLRPPVETHVNTGKTDARVEFEGMGLAAIGIRCTDGRVRGVLVHNAYLPKEGQAPCDIISMGRWWEEQGFYIGGRDDSTLYLGGFEAKHGKRNFSPVIPAVHMLWEGATCSSHTTGTPRNATSKLAHLRFGHMGAEKLGKLLGLPAHESPCHCCRVFKAKAPSAGPTEPEKLAEEVGARISIDFCHIGIPAVTTGWTKICAARDEYSRVVDAKGCSEPNGVWAATFLRYLWILYRTRYRRDILTARFDNDSMFCCKEVDEVLAEYKIKRELSAPYLHFQLPIERVWQTMIRDAACMIAFARRGKAYMTHACLHALEVRNATMIDEEHAVTRFEVATGKARSLEDFRIFGADAYAVLVPEKRKALRLDKADPKATYGVYIGNYADSRCWKLLTPGKVHRVGAGVIDEKALIRKAPTAHLDDQSDVEAIARDGQNIFEGSEVVGELVGDSPGGAAAVAADGGAPQRFDKADGVVPAVAPALAVADRPQRDKAPIVRFAPGMSAMSKSSEAITTGELGGAEHKHANLVSSIETKNACLGSAAARKHASATAYRGGREGRGAGGGRGTQRGQSTTATPAPAASASSAEESGGEEPGRYMIPSGIWSRFACAENGGQGWSVKIMRREGKHAWVRFTEATTREGRPWADHPMLPTMLVRLDKPEAPAPGEMASNAHSLDKGEALHACAMAIEDVTPPVELLDDEGGSTRTAAYDESLFLDAQSLPPGESAEMMIAVMRAGPPKAKPTQALVTLHGAPTWIALPRTAKEALELPNAPQWQKEMTAFFDNLESMDAIIVVPKSQAAGKELSRLSWVFKYKTSNGVPKEKARLVFNNTSRRGPWVENCFSDSVKAPHWKAIVHCGLRDGAHMCRRDIKSAHQTTRRDPNAEVCYSYAPPGMPLFVDGPNGKEEGIVCWLNMLNGMPPAGSAFSSDLRSHLRDFDMLQATQDLNVMCKLYSTKGESYIRIGINVDDIVVACKPKALIVGFDAHVRQRWEMTEAGLDGWLNIQFYSRGDMRTATLIMDARLSEIMHEHLPQEMQLAQTAYPKTPCHPRIRELALGDGNHAPELGKQTGRLQAQLIYQVVTIYYWAQYPIFYAARFGSKPTTLYLEVLLYALRSLYGDRHIGLTLGGTETETVLHGSSILGLHADAGHAEAGPSCGGHTIEIGNSTIHAMSGQHHATTLGTSDAELYEMSRAVAALIGFRQFMTEIGFSQNKPSRCNCDNMAVILKADSSQSDKKSQYMKRRNSFVQEAQMSGEIDVTHIAGEENRADILTKALAFKLFAKHRDRIMNVARSASNVHSAVAMQGRNLRSSGDE